MKQKPEADLKKTIPAHPALKSFSNLIPRFKYELGVIKSFLTNSTSKKFVVVDFGRAFVKIAYFEPKGKGYDLIDYDVKGFSSADENLPADRKSVV